MAALCEIGAPVVVKPQDGNQGKGVTVNIVRRANILIIAYAAAAEISSQILVERYHSRLSTFRLLVVGDRW